MQRQPLPAFDDCAWKWALVEQGWPSFKANFYAATDAYNAFQGISLAGGKMASKPMQPRVNYLERFGSQLRYGFCRSAQADTFWHVQRVGPFFGTGNYSWFQFTGLDVAELQQIILQQRAVAVIETYAGAVDGGGRGIAYPPMHIHHIHIVPQTKCEAGSAVCGMLNPSYVWFREQHGDFLYAEQTELLPSPAAKYLSFPLELDGEAPAELNDARPAGSSPLAFYLQIALRWSAGRRYEPVSEVQFGALGRYDGSVQLGHESYWWVPTDVRLVCVVSSQLDSRHQLLRAAYRGRVLFVRPHMHSKPLKRAFLFAGTTSEIGLRSSLHEERFQRDGGFTFTPLAETAFSSFGEVRPAVFTPPRRLHTAPPSSHRPTVFTPPRRPHTLP